MKLLLGVAAGVLAASTGYASAQAMKPGLWEIGTKMMGGSGEMADAMAQAQKQMGRARALRGIQAVVLDRL